MPCRSDYMEPNEREVQSKLTASLLVYVQSALGRAPKQTALAAMRNPYGDVGNLEDFVQRLCHLCRNMTEEQQNLIIYDGRNANARRLADWWDRHQEADRRREEREAQEAADAATLERLKATLTPDELRVLGVK